MVPPSLIRGRPFDKASGLVRVIAAEVIPAEISLE
jgi:hypothetical protein